MTKRPRFLIIAALLTFLDLAVVVCYGWPVWTTWSGDLWNRGILVLLASLGATSLANVWAQVVPAPNEPPCGRRATDKREVIAASLIAQLWNGRVSDRIELQRCTEQFNRLVEAHNADVEKKLSQKPGTSQQDAEATGSLTRGVRSLADSKGISPVEAEKIEASAPDATAASLQQDNLLLKRRGGCFSVALSWTGWCSPPRSLEGRTPRAPGKVDSHLL